MKKFFALTAIVAFLAIVAASCKSSSGGHCDAYGSIDNTENTDSASK